MTAEGGGGGLFMDLWVRVCQWDTETLILHQILFNHIVPPYSSLETKHPYSAWGPNFFSTTFFWLNNVLNNFIVHCPLFMYHC